VSEIPEDENVEKHDTTSFCGRIKHDWQIIKKNLTSKIVYKYYLFWLISGFMPSFSGMDYYMIMDVYKITPIQYGYINVIGNFCMVAGIFWF